MIGFSNNAGTTHLDTGPNYSADAFGKDIHHDDVHTPEAFSLVARVQSFRNLGADWDGYGAEAPSAEIVDLAFDAITAFDHRGCLPTRVMPGVANDIAMLWERDGFRSLLEITLDGWEWSIEYADGRETIYDEADGETAENAHRVRKSMLEA